MKLGLLIGGEYAVREAVELAALAEAEGFDHFWYADERFYHEPYGPLALCAARTGRIALGPCVTDPYTRHPALTALAIATLDELSNGRAVLGMGAGKSGLPELGIERHRPALALKEAVMLIRRLLAGQVVSFEGETVRFHDGQLNLRTRPDLRIFLASNSPLTATTAGEVADGAILAFCAIRENVKPMLERAEAGLKKAGRTRGEIEIALRLDSSVSSDGDAARDAVRPVITRLLYRSRDRLEGDLRALGVEVPPEWAQALRARTYRGYSRDPGGLDDLARSLPDEALKPFCLAGTVEEVAEQAGVLERLGADQLLIQPRAPHSGSVADVIRSWAREIRPRL